MVRVHLAGRLAVKCLMRPGLVVEHQVACQALMRSPNRFVRVQIDLLVGNVLPESCHEHVVSPAPFSVHADLNTVVCQQLRELLARELAPLIGTENLRRAIVGQGIPDGLQTETSRERVGKPPRQDSAPRPVQDGEQIDEAALHWNIG